MSQSESSRVLFLVVGRRCLNFYADLFFVVACRNIVVVVFSLFIGKWTVRRV